MFRSPAPPPAILRRFCTPNTLLAAVLLAALALRLYGIDWDAGRGFHPDERSFYLRASDMFGVLTQDAGYQDLPWFREHPEMRPGLPDIGAALSPAESPLNPHWFPLGSILIYALLPILAAAEPFTNWGALDLRFAGRILAALADTASVWMMFVIARRAYGHGPHGRRTYGQGYGQWTGLLAAALTAFAVIHIQHAHFYRPEPFTILASLGALWAMLRLIDTWRIRDAILLGVMVGLAMATKIAVAPILLPLLLTFLWIAHDRARMRGGALTPMAVAWTAPLVATTGAWVLLTFFITTPYALLDLSAFLADIREQTRMAQEAGHFPFTWQYADTPAFWYQIRQSAIWGLGLPLGIAAWVAAPFTLWMAWRGGAAARADWLLLAWAVPAFVFLELFEVKFLRYLFPLLPFYTLMAARMLTAALAYAQTRRIASAVSKPNPATAPTTLTATDTGRNTTTGADTDTATDIGRTTGAVADTNTGATATGFVPEDAPFSEEWHATPPTVGDDIIFDEPLAGSTDNPPGDSGHPTQDAPFSEEWHGTPPLAGTTAQTTPALPSTGTKPPGTTAQAPPALPPAGNTPSALRRLAAAYAGIRAHLAQLADRHCYKAAAIATGIVVAATVLYAVAFAGIYTREHPAVAASEWINENAPAGAAIVNAGSLWDERIPDLWGFDVWEFPAYHRPDDAGKIAELSGELSNADYLVFYSNRAYGAVSRLPDEFPRSAAFYRQLFAGNLGYQLERGFTSYPGLAGVSLRDNPYKRAGLTPPLLTPGGDDGQPGGIVIGLGYADENVVGYDHPQALVFRNTERLTATDLENRIAHAAAPALAAAAAPPLMLSPSAQRAQQSGGAWSDLFRRDGWAASVPWLPWLLAVELIALLAFPLTWWLLRPLPDRGILLTKAAGLLLTAWAAWMLVSSGAMPYSLAAIALAMAAVALPSALVLWRQWRPMLAWLRRNLPLVVTAEALFLLAFFAFLLIRAANPDLWHPWRGGEKPMELAYFTAVTRSSLMPPYDPWFSGGYLNYYYWGYFILSIPTRLTGIPPATVFNLAVPLLFALTAAGAGSLTYNLVAAARGRRPPAGDDDGNSNSNGNSNGNGNDGDAVSSANANSNGGDSDGVSGAPAPARWQAIWPSIRRRWLPGAAGITAVGGALLTAVAGNLDGAVQLFQTAASRMQGMAASLSSFDFWRSSRAIPTLEEFQPSALTPWLEKRQWVEEGYHITEFPYFTFLFADLHAHMMAIPFALLALGLALALLTGTGIGTGGNGRYGYGWRSPRAWATAALLGLAVGSLWAINSWDYPAYALLMVGIIGAAAWLMPGSGRARLLTGIGMAVLALAVSYAAFLPWHAATATFGTGIEPTRWRTPLLNYLLIHALPLLGAMALLGATLPAAARTLWARIRTRAAPLPAFSQWLLLGTAGGILLAVYGAAAGYGTASLLTLLLTLTAWALGAALTGPEYPARRSDVMALAMLALALGIGIGVDFVRVEGDIGRMNTLFKYYLVAWLLLAGAGAYGFWRGWTAVPSDGNRNGDGWRVQLRSAAATLVGIVALGALLYPALATPARIADRFGETPPTLDGMAYIKDAEYRLSEAWCGVAQDAPIRLGKDAGAIRWLQNNAAGAPTIVEAEGNQYCWNGRFSIYTGLPAVLGWPWHQTQQRGNAQPIQQRASDVAALYETQDWDEAADLLDKYGATYIIVGELERAFYAAGGIAKFEAMAAAGRLHRVYDRDGVRIYQATGGH